MRKSLHLVLCCLLAVPLAAQGIGGNAGIGGKAGFGGSLGSSPATAPSPVDAVTTYSIGSSPVSVTSSVAILSNDYAVMVCTASASGRTITASATVGTPLLIDSQSNTSMGITTTVFGFLTSANAGGGTFNCSSSGGTDTVIQTWTQWRGAATSSTIDVHNITDGTYSTTPSPTINTNFAADAIYVYGADDNGPSWGNDAGYTIYTGTDGSMSGSWHGTEYKAVSSTGGYSGKPTGPGASDVWTVGIMAIKGM